MTNYIRMRNSVQTVLDETGDGDDWLIKLVYNKTYTDIRLGDQTSSELHQSKINCMIILRKLRLHERGQRERLRWIGIYEKEKKDE